MNQGSEPKSGFPYTGGEREGIASREQVALTPEQENEVRELLAKNPNMNTSEAEKLIRAQGESAEK